MTIQTDTTTILNAVMDFVILEGEKCLK